jgi:hypothetical protein
MTEDPVSPSSKQILEQYILPHEKLPNTISSVHKFHILLQFDFPFIHTARVREYRFRPLGEEDDVTTETEGGELRLRSRATTSSSWNCDGETVTHTSVEVR